MLPSSFNLQGGTGISVGTPSTNQVGTNVQPGTGVSQFSAQPATVQSYTPTAQAAPAADPYAAYGGTAAYNSLVSGFAGQKQSIYGSATDATTNAGIGLNNGILDYIDSLKQSQSKIDNSAIDAELAKRQGTAGVLGMVGRGLRSGGVMLANRNAGDSSAGEALGAAYADIGRRSLSDVGNQYAGAERQIGLSQTNLNMSRASGLRKQGDSKTTVINNIVAQATDKLSSLDTAMMSASMPDRINIEQEKQNIRAQTLAQLQQYDEQLATGAASVNPMSQDQIMSGANTLGAAGTAPANAFSYTTQAPAQFQNTGPFSSELPLFTLPRSKQTA